MESEEFKSMRDKALQQLMSGQSLTGKDGVFAPLLKQFLESALDGEMAAHLNEHERSQGNKRNGKGSKTLKTSDGMVTISTPQDRQSNFEPQIVKKRETVLAVLNKLTIFRASIIDTSPISAAFKNSSGLYFLMVFNLLQLI